MERRARGSAPQVHRVQEAKELARASSRLLEADVDEYGIRELIGEVTRGRLSRRQFVVRNDEYDRLWRAAETEMDPVKRAAMFIRMNDLVVQNVVVIPVVIRHAVFATGNAIRGFDFSPFSGPLWRLVYGRRKRTRRRRPLHRGPAPGE